MRIWFALIVAPLLALTDQAVAFSLVGWACAHQCVGIVHASHALFLLIAMAAAAAGYLHWRKTASASRSTRQMHFLAGIAATVASLSALTIAAMWLPTWMISSCVA